MIILRNLVFNFFYFLLSIFWSVFLVWTLILPQSWAIKIVHDTYFTTVAILEKYLLGLTYKIEGWENIPQNSGFILAAKHQSAYETLKLPYLFADLAIVLKRELTWIPLWGWYPIKMGMIPIDRGSAKVAIESIIKGSKRILHEEKRPLLIFPEGTRTTVGETRKYKAGVGRIYEANDVPVIPVALNSGLFWGKNKFWKQPGCVTIKFLPPIEPGLETKTFMDRLQSEIEQESLALLPSPTERQLQ